jgi:hypothetical protein
LIHEVFGAGNVATPGAVRSPRTVDAVGGKPQSLHA